MTGFDALALAKADGTYGRVLRILAKADVLTLDDLGLGAPTDAQLHDLLEIVEDRYGRRSTVITSQLPVKNWHRWLNDLTLADAILDRLVHNAHRFELKETSLRKTDDGQTRADALRRCAPSVHMGRSWCSRASETMSHVTRNTHNGCC